MSLHFRTICRYLFAFSFLGLKPRALVVIVGVFFCTYGIASCTFHHSESNMGSACNMASTVRNLGNAGSNCV